MIRSIVIFLVTCSAYCTVLQAQNLVIDPGLEDTLQCPTTIGRFHHPTNTAQQYIAHWRSTTLASPDLHHTCGYNGFMPRTGEGYAGIILYDPTEYREYITALLSEPMVAGRCYYVSFHVALSAGSTRAVDEVQVHFSESVPLSMAFPPPGPLPLTPHLQAASTPVSTSYQKIAGMYQAIGGEQAMTFGNFMDNANTTITQVSSSGAVQAYYYIDDVEVILLDLGEDLAICGGEEANVVPNIQCPLVDYLWNDGSTGQTATVTSPGPAWLTITGNGTCAASDTLMVTIGGDGGTAGSDTMATTCASTPPGSLMDLAAADADPGGSFLYQGAPVTTALLSVPGEYTIQYVVAGGPDCEGDTALLAITVHDPPHAGADTSIIICQDASPIELDSLLGTPDPGGTWSSPAGTVHSGVLDPAIDESGAYSYYVQGIAPCPDDQAIVMVLVDPCTGISEGPGQQPPPGWLGQDGYGGHRFGPALEGRMLRSAWVADASGRQIAIPLVLVGGTIEADLSRSPSGTYLFGTMVRGNLHTIRFVHQAH